MRKLMKLGLCLVAVGVFCSAPLRAEEINSIFKRVNELVEQKSYPKALEELDWAKKEIEKMHMKRIQEFLPDNLAGFTGQKIDSNAVLGFSNVERTYTQGNNKVKLSLTGGSGGSASAMTGLAQLGKMAAMFQGANSGTDTIRIQGRTAMIENRPGSNRITMTVMLDSGSIMNLEGSEGISSDQLKSIAGALKLDELDTYLKGTK